MFQSGRETYKVLLRPVRRGGEDAVCGRGKHRAPCARLFFDDFESWSSRQRSFICEAEGSAFTCRGREIPPNTSGDERFKPQESSSNIVTA